MTQPEENKQASLTEQPLSIAIVLACFIAVLVQSHHAVRIVHRDGLPDYQVRILGAGWHSCCYSYNTPLTVEEVSNAYGQWPLKQMSILTEIEAPDGNLCVMIKSVGTIPRWQVWTPELRDWASARMMPKQMPAVWAEFKWCDLNYRRTGEFENL